MDILHSSSWHYLLIMFLSWHEDNMFIFNWWHIPAIGEAPQKACKNTEKSQIKKQSVFPSKSTYKRTFTWKDPITSPKRPAFGWIQADKAPHDDFQCRLWHQLGSSAQDRNPPLFPPLCLQRTRRGNTSHPPSHGQSQFWSIPRPLAAGCCRQKSESEAGCYRWGYSVPPQSFGVGSQ